MKDSPLALGRRESFYRDTDWNTLMARLAACIVGHGRVTAKALMEKSFINNAVQFFNGECRGCACVQPVKIGQNIFCLTVREVAAFSSVLPEHHIFENFLNVDFCFGHSDKYTQ